MLDSFVIKKLKFGWYLSSILSLKCELCRKSNDLLVIFGVKFNAICLQFVSQFAFVILYVFTIAVSFPENLNSRIF